MHHNFITGLSSGIAFILSFLLLIYPWKNNISAKRWLGLFMATYAYGLLNLLIHILSPAIHIKILNLIDLNKYLSAPALYLSTCFYIQPIRKFRTKDLWHFLPFMIFLLFNLKFILTGNDLQLHNISTARIILAVIAYTLPLQIAFYWLMSVVKLLRYQIKARKPDTAESCSLAWLIYFLLILAAVILSWLASFFLHFKLVSELTPFLYLASVCFPVFFSLR